MATFQVVAVYPSGTRYKVRGDHRDFMSALSHRDACERQADPRDTWAYEIDMYYEGSDGCRHWRGGVTGADLGYPPEETEPAVDRETVELRAEVAERVEDMRIAVKHEYEAAARPMSPENRAAYQRAMRWTNTCREREREARARLIKHVAATRYAVQAS